MRILHVIDKMDPKLGGVCMAVRMLIKGLSKQGIRNEVVSLDDFSDPFIHDDKFVIHALGKGRGPWNSNPQLLPWLLRNIVHFDVVIVHGLWLYHSYAVRKAFTMLKKEPRFSARRSHKLFVMPHGMLDPYFQKASGRKLKAIRNKIYWGLLEKKVINEADGLFFTCQNERHLASQPFSEYRPTKEIVVGLGIEPPPIYTPEIKEAFLEKCNAVRGQKYILFLGRIHEKKGVDILVRSYHRLKDKPVKLLIAGPGFETPYGQMIIRQINANEVLKNNIIHCGMLTGNAKWGAFYGSEAFILPSHQENFGIAVVEALSCGKPVLISNQVNICKEIEAGQGGIIADDTLDGTYQLLTQWNMLTEDEKHAFSRKAKELFEEKFAIEPTVKEMISALA